MATADATTWTWSLPANGHGYYEVALDKGSLTWTPASPEPVDASVD